MGLGENYRSLQNQNPKTMLSTTVVVLNKNRTFEKKSNVDLKEPERKSPLHIEIRHVASPSNNLSNGS